MFFLYRKRHPCQTKRPSILVVCSVTLYSKIWLKNTMPSFDVKDRVGDGAGGGVVGGEGGAGAGQSPRIKWLSWLHTLCSLTHTVNFQMHIL